MRRDHDLKLPPFRMVHMAYVTDDLEAGIRFIADAFGVDEVRRFNGAEIEVPGGVALIDFVVANAGGTAIEAIQPIGGRDDIYRAGLPERSAVKFHHLASRILDQAEWDLLWDTVRRCNLDILVHGESSAVKYVYIDTREQLGHLMEYIWFSDAPAKDSRMEKPVETAR